MIPPRPWSAAAKLPLFPAGAQLRPIEARRLHVRRSFASTAQGASFACALHSKIWTLAAIALIACSARAEEPLFSLAITGRTDTATGDMAVLSADARGLNDAGKAALPKTKIVWTSGGRVLQEGGRLVVNIAVTGAYDVVALLVRQDGGRRVILQTARHTVDFAAQHEAIAAAEKKTSDEMEKRLAADHEQAIKQRAEDLRAEGRLLEEGGDLAGAVAKYDASLALAPDKSVTARIDEIRKDLAAEQSAARLAEAKKQADLAAGKERESAAAGQQLAAATAEKERLEAELARLADEKKQADAAAAMQREQDAAARLADEKKQAELAAEKQQLQQDAEKQLAAAKAEKDQLAAEVARLADEKKQAELAARLADEQKQADLAAEKKRLAEETDKQVAAEKAEKDRLAAEVARLAEEKKQADLAARAADEKKQADLAAEKKRMADEADKQLAAEKADKDRLAAEVARLADEKKQAELAAEKQRQADADEKQRLEAAARAADEQKQADLAAENKRIADEADKQLAAEKAEKDRLAAEVARLAEEKKQADLAAQKQQEQDNAARLADEKKQAELVAEKKRAAEETDKQLAAEKAEKDRLAAEVARLADEKKQADLAAEAEKKSTPAPVPAPPVVATLYAVSLAGPESSGRLPKMWDADKRKLIDVSDRFAVFQDLVFSVSVSPSPSADAHYEWTIQPAGLSTRSPSSREMRAKASAPGTYEVAVTVRDDHDAVLGSASTSVTISISSEDLDWSLAAQEADAQLTRAKGLVAKGQLDEGLELAAEAAKADPKSKDAQAAAAAWSSERKTVLEQLALSRTWMAKMDYERAQKEWAKAGDLHPRYPPVRELEDELQALKKTLDRAQDLVNDGYALEKRGKATAAMAKYEAALKLAPDDKLAARLADLKRKQAESDAQKLIDEGYALEKSGDTAGAIACYEKTYALFPDARVVGHVNALKSK